MMNSLLTPLKPFTSPTEEKSFSVLSSVFTAKISSYETQGQWTLYEITDAGEFSSPYHTYPWDQSISVIEGEMEIQLSGQTKVLSPGDVELIPAGVPHTLKVLKPIRVSAIFSPGIAEHFYQEMSQINGASVHMDKLKAIAAKYGVW